MADISDPDWYYEAIVVRERALQQIARVRRGEIPINRAAAELGMMPFELEAIVSAIEMKNGKGDA